MNILAVEVHQVIEALTDVAFDTEATIQFSAGPNCALRAFSIE
jgi:hypothetical protein